MLTWVQSYPWLIIIVGTVIFAAGGFIATWGWDLRSSIHTREALQRQNEERIAEQRTTMMRAVWNDVQVSKNLIAHGYSEEDPAKLKLGRVMDMPPLRDVSLRAAISSGIFAHEQFAKFNNDISYLTYLMSDFEVFNKSLGESMLLMLLFPGNKEKIAGLRAQLHKSERLEKLKAQLDAVEADLIAMGIQVGSVEARRAELEAEGNQAESR